MNKVSKFFNELTVTELYEILKARTEIFVVEQNCVYQDMDGVDGQSLHIYLEENGHIKAYMRAFEKDADTVKMGRVLSTEHGKGYGGMLLKYGIEQIKTIFDPKRIYIEAQTYAAGYYAKAGFKVRSEEFILDGIPHIKMILDLK